MTFCSIFSNDKFQRHTDKNDDQIENEFEKRFRSLLFCQFHVDFLSKNLNQRIEYQTIAKSIDRKFDVNLYFINRHDLRSKKKKKINDEMLTIIDH